MNFIRGCFKVFITFFFIVLVLIFGSIYFYIDGVPAISNFVVNRLPTSIDKEVGQKVRKEILKKAPIDDDKTQLLNEFYEELHFDNKTKVYVVKANEFNAFALPDNSIFVFDKVLYDVTTYEELAALLGHEYAHIKYRHSIKSIAQSLSWELLGKVISSDDNSNDFVRNSNLLLTLENSRAFETQADIGGLEFLREQHIDQKGMADLFQTMLKLPQEDKKQIPSYINTHPDTEERFVKVEEIIKEKTSNNEANSKLEIIFNKLTLKE
jgi:predicted Zn-dependent protease